MKIVFLKGKLIKLFMLMAILICMFMLCITQISEYRIKQVNAKAEDSDICKNYKNFILAFMNPYIYDALKEHFGYVKNFDLFDIKILKVEDHTYKGYYFDIVLEVTSYVGAHLSDFSENVLTLRLDEKGIYLINFK